ncbi:MAG: corrinoid protein [Acidobacteriota bacterium]|nr:corrinoid protein [Acidobacteriota bacterium]
MPILDQLSDAVQRGRVLDVLSLIEVGLADGVPAKELLDGGLLVGIERLGVKFRKNEVWVPEVMSAARALNRGLQVLRPLIIEAGGSFKGKVVIGTVHGDLHDVGKNLVGLMLEGSGFEVIDLGVNVSAQGFVQAVEEHRPDILCLSALLTTTISELKEVIDAVANAGLRDDVRILVGGAPVTSDLATTIGADGYAQDAAAATGLASRLMGLAQ